jgi:hypothetical protein
MTWQAIGSSVQGSGHVPTSTPCQDAHGYRVTDDYAIAVIADGLGSADQSEKGAHLAVETTLDLLDKALRTMTPSAPEAWTETLKAAFDLSRQKLESVAERSGLPLREYGTTLIAVAVTLDWIAIGHLGDGAVVVLSDQDSVETISAPQHGEYANEVVPLTALDALASVRFTVRQQTIKAAALLTDGLQSLSINSATNEPYTPFFAPFFEAICGVIDTADASQALARFLLSERICERTDDDKTLVVLGKVPRPSDPC